MTVIQKRPLKGSRIASFYPVKELPPLSALDSAFQLEEYISLLIRLDVHDVDAIVSLPGKQGHKEREGSDDSKLEDKDVDSMRSEVIVDESCWIYEQLRRLAQDLSHPLITMLQQECTRQSCPEMKAGEWLYLCVAHGNDGAMEQCCAIDYILHTVDSATALLNSPRAFPSRLSIPQSSHRHFTSLARRLGRIFAHAYYHHREAFEQAEAESSLYARFLALTSKFGLVPPEFLVIPPRIPDGQEPDSREDSRGYLSVDLDRDRERRSWSNFSDSGSVVDLSVSEDGTNSPPGPAGSSREASPRKMGRNRTDTMVYSEAIHVAEELARTTSQETPDPELDRAISEGAGHDQADAILPPVSTDTMRPFRGSFLESQVMGVDLGEIPPADAEPVVEATDEVSSEQAPVTTQGDVLDIPAPDSAEPGIPMDIEDIEDGEEEEEQEQEQEQEHDVQESSHPHDATTSSSEYPLPEIKVEEAPSSPELHPELPKEDVQVAPLAVSEPVEAPAEPPKTDNKIDQDDNVDNPFDVEEQVEKIEEKTASDTLETKIPEEETALSKDPETTSTTEDEDGAKPVPPAEGDVADEK